MNTKIKTQFARVFSAQAQNIHGQIVTIEVDITRGMHSFTLVGLPNKAVEEARDRVGSALRNSHFPSPKYENNKTIVSLAPAEVRKEGSHYDLAIAIGYLLARGHLNADVSMALFLGELSLNGELRPITGALALTHAAKVHGCTRVCLPNTNAKEASYCEGVEVFGFDNLKQVVGFLNNNDGHSAHKNTHDEEGEEEDGFHISLDEVRGQETAKRALEIAASGRHNIALYGPPGTGKTMLAKAFRTMLPKLTRAQALEVTAIHSVSGVLDRSLVTTPPFRAPHHTASYASIIGGGSYPKPGEITLAHRGVLFFDEFPEFSPKVLESLRQPLEDREVHITRARARATFPAEFIFVAALNPCPCGYAGSEVRPCSCSNFSRERYQQKISGPIMDRIDMWIPVEHVAYEDLLSGVNLEKDRGEQVDVKNQNTMMGTTTNSKEGNALKNAIKARLEFQVEKRGGPNAYIKPDDILQTLSLDAQEVLKKVSKKLHLSPRAFHRVARVARTIADIEGDEKIGKSHVLEACQYRPPTWIVGKSH